MSRQQWVKNSGLFLLIMMAGLVVSGFIATLNKNGLNQDRDLTGHSTDFSIFMPEMPGEIDFAGEPVPLDNFDTRESLDRELLVNTYWHSQTIQLIKRSHRYFPVIEEILRNNKVPEDFKYIPLVESGLLNVTSPAGAVGYWQFLKGTAKDYGLEVNGEVDERYHLEKSTEAACRYIHDAYEQVGNWTLVAASFNMGKKGIENQINTQKETNYYNLLLGEETERYVFRLLALKLILKHPEEYGFRIKTDQLYPVIDTYHVEVDTSVHDFAGFAGHFQTNYKMLKYFNPWLRKPYLSNKSGKTYTITLPAPGARTRKYFEVLDQGDTNME
ncbi:MAG: lytic transglycosylase domain-containing protein [Chlorobi bacterium]|nr:lytic transglycosylase domain-containing protein [Chlorobiota bacterium]